MDFFTQTPAAGDFWSTFGSSVGSASAADWLSSVGTVSATVVALIFGIGGFRASQNDRRAREVQARRDQARVYCWLEDYGQAGETKVKAWIKNDTELPIYGAYVNIFTEKDEDGKAYSWSTTRMLAPKETQTIELNIGDFGGRLLFPTVHISVYFTDPNGFAWMRHPGGALTPFPPSGKTQLPTPLSGARPAPN